MASKGVKFKDASGNAVYPCPYYPVGSIYMSVNNINPSNIFGGTWEQIKDVFLLACGNTYANGSTGGNKEHVHNITIGQATWFGVPLEEDTYGLYVKNGNGVKSTTRSGELVPAGVTRWRNPGLQQGATTFTHDGFAIETTGETYKSNNMPPYLAVYVWKRTA